MAHIAMTGSHPSVFFPKTSDSANSRMSVSRLVNDFLSWNPDKQPEEIQLFLILINEERLADLVGSYIMYSYVAIKII